MNVGCIPSKALLHASELFEEPAIHSQDGHRCSVPKLDLKAMMAFKDEGVDGNVKGVEFLLKKNTVDAFHGAGRIAAPGKVEVKGADGKTRHSAAKSIVIATGSDVARLQGDRHRRKARRFIHGRPVDCPKFLSICSSLAPA